MLLAGLAGLALQGEERTRFNAIQKELAELALLPQHEAKKEAQAHAALRLLSWRQRLGRAEDDHDAVADELVDRGAMLVREIRDLGEIPIAQPPDHIRPQTLGERREAHDIGEHHREHSALGRRVQAQGA